MSLGMKMNKYQYLAQESRNSIRRFIGCERKRAFDTEQDARDTQPSQEAYKCTFCDKWHLTNVIKRARRRRRV
jgi:ribosomal protein L44E